MGPNARVEAWRAAMSSLRNPPSPTSRNADVAQLSANLTAVFDLPSQGVASDILVLIQSVPTTWLSLEAPEHLSVCSGICHLVLDISSRVQLEYKTPALLTLVRFLRRIIESSSSRCGRGFDEDPGKGAIHQGTKAEWAALRALVQVLHENGGQLSADETSSLLDLLLRSVRQPDFAALDQSRRRKPWSARSECVPGEAKARYGQEDREYQRLVYTAIGNLFARAGALVSKNKWIMVMKVLRSTLEMMTSTKLVEDAAASRSYAAVLRCVHLVLLDSKDSLEEYVAGYVGALRVFFTYGLPNCGSALQLSNTTSLCQGVDTKSGQTGDATMKAQESVPYKPPHLRNKPPKSGSAGSTDVSGSKFEGRGLGGISSDSELSDSEGQHEESDRHKCFKVRTSAVLSIQALARVDPKVLHAHWVILLPTHDVLQPRPYQATLMTILLFDPVLKVRMAAASTVAVMLEGPARAFLQVAEHKDFPRSKSFTTLSTSLGQLVIQLLIGFVHVIINETSGGILVATLKALSLVLAGSPFSRLPEELLPYALFSVHQKARDLSLSSADQSTLMSATVSALGVALNCTPPSRTVAETLAMEAPPATTALAPSLTGPSCSHLLLPDLISYTAPPNSAAVRMEAFQALKAAVHTYPSVLSKYWELISRSIVRTIECPDDSEGVTESSDSSSGLTAGRKAVVTVGPTMSVQPTNLSEDKVVHSAIKFLDEFLRATCGQQGTEESADDGFFQPPSPFLEPKPTKLLLAATSSSPAQHVADSIRPEAFCSEAARSFWLEALHRHLPPALVHPAPMVRGAALTCFAGFTGVTFSSLPSDEQSRVLSIVIHAAWNDDTPAVRSAACRAIGVVMSFPQAAGSKEKLPMAVDVLISSTTDTFVSVRITASWALANICNALRNIAEISDSIHAHNPPPPVHLAPLAECALKAAKDCDKVRANAVRALGNLARFANFGGPPDLQAINPSMDSNLQPQDIGQSQDLADHQPAEASKWLGVMVQTLVSCVTTGNVKVQWNVCHALGNLFLNKTICLARMQWVPSVYSILLLLLRDSANFKIRIHSAAALAVPATREDYGDSYGDVLKALMHALDSLAPEHESAPTSFKYNMALTEQLTVTILHVLGLAVPEDFFCLKDFLLKKGKLLQDILLSQCAVDGLSASNTSSSEPAVLDPMLDPSVNDITSKGCAYDERPLPPPKLHRRYGLQFSDSVSNTSDRQAQKAVHIRKAISALAEMYRYGGITNPLQKLEPFIIN